MLRCGRLFGPRDQSRCGSPKPSHHFEQKRCRCSPAIVGPKGEPHGLQSQFGAAALIGDRKTVSSDTEFAALHPGEADAAGAQNDDGSILAAMRPQASNVRIAHINDPSKRMRETQKRFTSSFTINS